MTRDSIPFEATLTSQIAMESVFGAFEAVAS
jgi:hypothetical protein